MSGEIVNFPINHSNAAERTSEEPVQHVIEILEKRLEMARAGIIRSFAMVTVEKAGHAGTEWCETAGWYHEIVSGLELCKFRFLCSNSGYAPDNPDAAS